MQNKFVNNSKSKNIRDKRTVFSIRKFSFGAASVAIAAFMFLGPNAYAAETTTTTITASPTAAPVERQEVVATPDQNDLALSNKWVLADPVNTSYVSPPNRNLAY